MWAQDVGSEVRTHVEPPARSVVGILEDSITGQSQGWRYFYAREPGDSLEIVLPGLKTLSYLIIIVVNVKFVLLVLNNSVIILMMMSKKVLNIERTFYILRKKFWTNVLAVYYWLPKIDCTELGSSKNVL